MSISHEEELGLTKADLADLPDSFPPCLIRDDRIARADGLPLEWEQYDLLDENFPATSTESGELEMSPRPVTAHRLTAPSRSLRAQRRTRLD
jgi:hypothetical protein